MVAAWDGTRMLAGAGFLADVGSVGGAQQPAHSSAVAVTTVAGVRRRRPPDRRRTSGITRALPVVGGVVRYLKVFAWTPIVTSRWIRNRRRCSDASSWG